MKARSPAYPDTRYKPAPVADLSSRKERERLSPAGLMAVPPLSLIRRYDTHRLVPSKRSDSVLVRIADDDAHLKEIFDLDQATNDRLLAEHGALPGIGPHELVFGVPYSAVVNAAF